MDNTAPDADELVWDLLTTLHSRVKQQLAKALQRRHGLGLSDYRALGSWRPLTMAGCGSPS